MVTGPAIEVASIGIPDTLFLMLLALVVFGPRRLPEIGRQIGKLMYEFRKVSNDFKYQMEEELRASEEADRQKKLATASTLSSIYPPAETIYPPAIAPMTLDTSTATAPAEAVEPVAEPVSEPVIVPVIEPIHEPIFDTELAVATDSSIAPETKPTEPDAYRGEARRFPNIQPPASGDPVEAARPFRYRVPDEFPASGETPVTAPSEAKTDSGLESETHHA